MAHYKTVITKALDGFRQGSSVKHYENDESSPSDGNRRRIYFGRGRSTRNNILAEKVDLKSLPASVRETINQKAAGGSIVKVLREDDPDGKWNYEVFVKANGKESGFEVDPNGQSRKDTHE